MVKPDDAISYLDSKLEELFFSPKKVMIIDKINADYRKWLEAKNEKDPEYGKKRSNSELLSEYLALNSKQVLNTLLNLQL